MNDRHGFEKVTADVPETSWPAKNSPKLRTRNARSMSRPPRGGGVAVTGGTTTPVTAAPRIPYSPVP